MFGFLNINKPPDMTSRDVVNVVQRLVKPHKAGHAGTLDPMATGVLLVAVGKATRLISLAQQLPKVYLAEFQLGVRSDTDDITGNVTAVDVPADTPAESQVREQLNAFVGTIDQIPPAFSAVKVSGERAYDKARRGEGVELRSRKVDVYQIDLLWYRWPTLSVRIRCGSGTYIRSIARDLGELLNCGGLMTSLVRESSGPFAVTDGLSPDGITAQTVEQSMVNPVCLVQDQSRYRTSPEEMEFLKAGRALTPDQSRLEMIPGRAQAQVCSIAFVSSDGKALLALGEADMTVPILQPRTVLI